MFAVIAGAVGLAFVYSGYYDISTMTGHYPPVQWALNESMRRSVMRHSADIQVPDLSDPRMVRVGFRCFHDNCVACHGAPGIPPGDAGKGLMPIPNSLVQPGRDWPAQELYWVTRNGIRMAGMPAWGYRFSEENLWAIVAFLKQLPRLTTAQYHELIQSVDDVECGRPSELPSNDPESGRTALRQYGCHGCHIIPGVVGPNVHVGPTLEGFANRKFIAGILPNSTENLVRWIREPQSVSPLTTMPDMQVTEAHAIEMAHYLQTLK